MPSIARFAAALLALSISACSVTVNSDFTAPDKTNLIIGQSTERDVIQAEGPPQSQTITTRADHFAGRPKFNWALGGAKHYDILRYSYGQTILGGASSIRSANFLLADGRLAGWEFESDDPSQSTDFDVPQAQKLLASGTPDLATLQAAIGQPSGRLIYPLTMAPDVREMTWEYAGIDKSSGKRVVKTLAVLIGPDNKIVSYYVHQADAPLSVAQTRTVVVPIIVR